MRRLIFITIALIFAPTFAAASPIKDDDSPELKQCVYECRSEKDATAREACDVTCVKAEQARKKQNDAAPTSPVVK